MAKSKSKNGNKSKRSLIRRTHKTYIPRWVSTKNPIPQTMHTTLWYSQVVALNPAAFGIGLHTFRANDLYDPDYTGVGHQPMGFDQLMALYGKFTVLKSKLTIYPASNNVGGNGWLAVRTCTTPTGVSSLEDFTESSGAVIRSYNEATTTSPISTSYSMAESYPGASISDEGLWGTASGIPAELNYHQVAYLAAGTGDPPEMNILCQVQYEVVFHDPIVLAAS